MDTHPTTHRPRPLIVALTARRDATTLTVDVFLSALWIEPVPQMIERAMIGRRYAAFRIPLRQDHRSFAPVAKPSLLLEQPLSLALDFGVRGHAAFSSPDGAGLKSRNLLPSKL